MIPMFIILGVITSTLQSIKKAAIAVWDVWTKDSVRHGGFLWAVGVSYASAKETWNNGRWIGFKEMQQIRKRRNKKERLNSIMNRW